MRIRKFRHPTYLVALLGLLGVIYVSTPVGEEFVALDDALRALEELDPRKTKIVVLRFFGGLSVEETAEVMGLSPRTVTREWSLARAWLYRELSPEPP